MKKLKFLVISFSSILLFFIMFSINIHAEETIIYELPTAKEIAYGDILYKAELVGGSANTKGIFLWKNEEEMLPVGIHERTALFIPSDTNYNTKEFNLSLKVNKKKVTLKFESKVQKQYDGTATLKLPNYIVKGIIDNDTYISGIAAATTESILVGENIPFTITGLSITGEHKDNYYLYLDNLAADICPKYIEKANKEKIIFDNNKSYINPNSTFVIAKTETNISKKGYSLKAYYDIHLENNHQKVEINTGKVTLKLKIDNNLLKSKRIHLFNYVNNQYEELKYEIDENGYILYDATNLGDLVIMKKNYNFTWLYVVVSLIFTILLIVLLTQLFKNKKPTKIKKYRSLKRRKDDGNN